MGAVSQDVYDYYPVRVRKADGSITTIGMQFLELLKLRRRFPDKKVRVAALNRASAEFDALFPLTPRTHKANRSLFVRNALNLADD